MRGVRYREEYGKLASVDRVYYVGGADWFVGAGVSTGHCVPVHFSAVYCMDWLCLLFAMGLWSDTMFAVFLFSLTDKYPTNLLFTGNWRSHSLPN
jgi:hypothetical protein